MKSEYLPNEINGTFIDVHKFKLGEDYPFIDPTTGEHWVVPKGFMTDGSSVPRFFWRLEDPFGEALRAAIPHDYFCKYDAVPRKQADQAFYTWLLSIGVSRIKALLMYIGVRIGARF